MSTMVKVVGFVVGFVIYWAGIVTFLLLPLYLVEHNDIPWWQDAIYMGLGIATARFVHLTWKKKR